MKAVILCFFFLVTFSHAEKKFELPMPTKCEKNYKSRMALFARFDHKVKPNSTIMVGDSITQSFPVKKAPEEWRLVNRGISGDCIGGWKYQGLYDRLQECVYKHKPSRVYIAIGINDTIQWFEELKSASLEQKIAGYHKIITGIQAKLPQCEIICQSVLPVRGRHAKYNKDIVQFNMKLRELANELKVTYFDLHSKFKDEKGHLKKDMSRDGCHLKPEAYDFWIEQLKELWSK